jgi:hypothetical protein
MRYVTIGTIFLKMPPNGLELDSWLSKVIGLDE